MELQAILGRAMFCIFKITSTAKAQTACTYVFSRRSWLRMSNNSPGDGEIGCYRQPSSSKLPSRQFWVWIIYTIDVTLFILVHRLSDLVSTVNHYPYIKLANIFFMLDDGWSLTESTNIAIPLLEKDPIGRTVSRTPSDPIIVDIPEGDIEAPSTWNKISVQLGELGVGMILCFPWFYLYPDFRI
jgi:hypothetical protein